MRIDRRRKKEKKKREVESRVNDKWTVITLHRKEPYGRQDTWEGNDSLPRAREDCHAKRQRWVVESGNDWEVRDATSPETLPQLPHLQWGKGGRRVGRSGGRRWEMRWPKHDEQSQPLHCGFLLPTQSLDHGLRWYHLPLTWEAPNCKLAYHYPRYGRNRAGWQRCKWEKRWSCERKWKGRIATAHLHLHQPQIREVY